MDLVRCTVSLLCLRDYANVVALAALITTKCLLVACWDFQGSISY